MSVLDGPLLTKASHISKLQQWVSPTMLPADTDEHSTAALLPWASQP